MSKENRVIRYINDQIRDAISEERYIIRENVTNMLVNLDADELISFIKQINELSPKQHACLPLFWELVFIYNKSFKACEWIANNFELLEHDIISEHIELWSTESTIDPSILVWKIQLASEWIERQNDRYDEMVKNDVNTTG